MEIITGHINTDMDCFASMYAASLLYPQAVLVFPGTLNRNVREFYSLHKDLLRVRPLKGLDLSQVTRLVIVDTSVMSRIGELAQIVRAGGAEVIIYDHHRECDIPYGQRIHAPVGANTTLLCEAVQRQNGAVSSFAATVMAMGLYEDTGCFTYAGTVMRDVAALAYLFQFRPELRVVRDYVKWDIDLPQLALFNELLASQERLMVNGHPIIVVTAERQEFVADVAVLVQKIADITDASAVIAVIRMGRNCHVIGRGDTIGIDLVPLFEKLGGGGHSQAAAAVLKNSVLAAAVARVKALLPLIAKSVALAQDIMTHQVKTATPDMTVDEVADVLVHYGHTGLPVMHNDRIVGVISRRDVDKARMHHLGHAPVKGFMSTHVITAPPTATVREIENLLVSHDIGRIPITADGRLIGIVTRSDVLRYLHGQALPLPYTERAAPRYVIPDRDTVRALLSRHATRHLLERAGEIAAAQGFKAAVVGGFVRDLLLGEKNEDIDIVIEGDALAFAHALARACHGQVKNTSRFGTVTLVASRRKIDVATARTEYYAKPAALPTVAFSALHQDLARRDFTINAMGVVLNPAEYGQLLDYYGGYSDLRNGVIRVLYNMSFVEDPTRMIRALRFAARFGFTLADDTRQFLRQGIADRLWEKLSVDRLRREVRLVFAELHWPAILDMMQETGMFGPLFCGVSWSQVAAPLAKLPSVLSWLSQAGVRAEPMSTVLYLLCRQLPPPVRQECWQKYVPGRRGEKAGVWERDYQAHVACLVAARERYAIYACLHQLPPEIWANLLLEEAVADKVRLFINELRGQHLSITGEEIMALGIPRGRRVGEIMRQILAAKINGAVSSPEQELVLAKLLASKKEAIR